MSERGERKRFARAVSDEVSHTGDEEFQAELDVVDRLRQAGAETAVGQQTRQDVAARMARKAAEWDAPAGTAPDVAARPARLGRRRRLRPVLACSLSVTAGLVALAVVCSSGALPGDLLYTVKRARESAVLTVTLDDRAAAVQRLDYAADRVTELEQLATQADEQDGLPAAYRSGFADFDSAARTAAATLTTVGTNTGDGAVAKLRNWSERQSRRLHELRPSLSPAVSHREQGSTQLLGRIANRAKALHARFDCYRITTGRRDSLGPLPASGQCVTSDEQWSGNGAGGRSRSGTPPESSGTTTEQQPDRDPRTDHDHARQVADHEQANPSSIPGRTERSPSPTGRADRDRFRPSRSVPAAPPTDRPHRQTDTSGEQSQPDPPDLGDTLHGVITGLLPDGPTESGRETTPPSTAAG